MNLTEHMNEIADFVERRELGGQLFFQVCPACGTALRFRGDKCHAKFCGITKSVLDCDAPVVATSPTEGQAPLDYSGTFGEWLLEGDHAVWFSDGRIFDRYNGFRGEKI